MKCPNCGVEMRRRIVRVNPVDEELEDEDGE